MKTAEGPFSVPFRNPAGDPVGGPVDNLPRNPGSTSAKRACSAWLLCLLIAFTAAACGQRGPLYLPEIRPTPAQDGAADTPADETEENQDEETPGA